MVIAVWSLPAMDMAERVGLSSFPRRWRVVVLGGEGLRVWRWPVVVRMANGPLRRSPTTARMSDGEGEIVRDKQWYRLLVPFR